MFVILGILMVYFTDHIFPFDAGKRRRMEDVFGDDDGGPKKKRVYKDLSRLENQNPILVDKHRGEFLCWDL